MIVTQSSLNALFIAFKVVFQKAQTGTPTDWQKIATIVPSSTRSNTYGWLGQFPAFREWVGDRVLKDMAAHGYTIDNKKYESSIVVSRTDIEDDQVGIYSPLIEEMGRASTAHPDELVFALLKAGLTTKCYDGQNFFDTDHPVYPNSDATGEAVSVSNFQDGAGPAWYLMDISRAIKPIIFQKRQDYGLKAMTRVDDESVFMRDEYRFGVDARVNAGFGFWQFAYCSKAPLTAESYEAARAAMMEFKSDGGRPLGVVPRLLLVPPALEGKARSLLLKDANGGNPWAGSAEPLVSTWLS